jgi:hypothetical protein
MLEVRVATFKHQLIPLDIMPSVVVMVFTPNRYAAVQALDLVLCVTYDFVAVRVEDREADRLDFDDLLAGSAFTGPSEYAFIMQKMTAANLNKLRIFMRVARKFCSIVDARLVVME